MSDPAKNPDGTVQVSPPKVSAFAKQKSDPAPAASPDSTDHETGIIAHLRGMIAEAMKPKEVTEGGVKVDDAVKAAETGIAQAPGGTEYGGGTK